MSDKEAKGPGPAIPAFSTLKTLIKPFKEHETIPGQIDRSVLTSFSGAVGSQVMTMLKFLGLTDTDGRTTPKMTALVQAYDTADWPSALGTLIREAYAPIFKLSLETASSKEFTDEFRRVYPATDDVSRKQMTFFLNATREAGIKISPFVMKGKKPRSVQAKKRAAKGGNSDGADAASKGNGSSTPPQDPPLKPETERTPYEVLMHQIYDPKAMGAGSDEEKAVFTLARYLRTREAA